MHAIRYNTIDRAYPFRLRGTNQQTQTGLLWATPTYRTTIIQGGALPSASTNQPSQGIALGYVNLHNRSGGTILTAIGVRIPNRYWLAGQWDDDAGTPFTDDTTDAQDPGASDVALESTTNNDGYVIASQVPFNAWSWNIGTASAGGAAVRAVRYSNTAGDGWTDFGSNLFVQDAVTGDYVTGEQIVVAAQPTNWGRITGTGLSGIPAGYYAINVRATTAPTVTAGSGTSLEIFHLVLATENVADNGGLEWANSPSELFLQPEGDALVAMFSGTANNQNRVTVNARLY